MKESPIYLYILKCRDGSLYTGITKDLQKRFHLHEQGKASRYTRGRGPFVLEYWEGLKNRSLALKKEMAVKKLSRKEKLSLIELFKEKTNANGC